MNQSLEGSYLLSLCLLRHCAYLTGIIGLCGLAAAQDEINKTPTAQVVQKVQVTATNNYRLDKRYLNLQLPVDPRDAHLQALRDYVAQHNGIKSGNNEFQEILQITAWVHRRWQHDVMGTAPSQATAMDILHLAEQGERFSCVEYSKVLRDVLHSRGIPARIVSLQSPEVAYGGLGSAHVIVEAWSNTYNKWILADAQWAVYAAAQGVPLNVYEIYQRVKSKHVDTVAFKPVAIKAKPDAKAQPLDQDYHEFITAYFGYMSTNYMDSGQALNVLLPLAGKDHPLTLQGLPRNVRVFAHEPREVYIDVNHVMLLLRFRPEAQGKGSQILDITTAQEYLDKMADFAAVPDFDVGLQHNMPWFDHYQVAIDTQPWRDHAEGILRWTLHKGSNRLAVRAVNAFGKIGAATYYEITYQ